MQVSAYLWYADVLAFPFAQALPGSSSEGSEMDRLRMEDVSVPWYRASTQRTVYAAHAQCRLVGRGGTRRTFPRTRQRLDQACHFFLQSCETIGGRWTLPLPQIVRRFTHLDDIKTARFVKSLPETQGMTVGKQKKQWWPPPARTRRTATQNSVVFSLKSFLGIAHRNATTHIHPDETWHNYIFMLWKNRQRSSYDLKQWVLRLFLLKTSNDQP